MISDTEIEAAQEKLKAEGVEMEYTTSSSAGGGGGGGPVFKTLSVGMDRQEAYRCFMDALGYVIPGPLGVPLSLPVDGP